MSNTKNGRNPAFTLIELLVVVAIIGLLIGLLAPTLAHARAASRGSACLSNERQIGLAARLYMDDNHGGLFHHHEGWVLDDGTQEDNLPATPAACSGGGTGNSQAEKPWVILFQPYLQNRPVCFCPADPTPRSRQLATDRWAYDGNITDAATAPAPDSELDVAQRQHLTIESYLLNSIFTHKSARYAVEGVLHGFATDTQTVRINADIILFSERNSEALTAPDNDAFGYVRQDDYDTWAGEAALVRWGSGPYADQGWLRYNRHEGGANYVHPDGHAVWARWHRARFDEYPDRVVRRPLVNPP